MQMQMQMHRIDFRVTWPPFVSYYMQLQSFDPCRVTATSSPDDVIYWYISAGCWHSVVHNIPGTGIWHIVRGRGVQHGDREEVCELYDVDCDVPTLVYDGPYLDYAHPSFPHWYKQTQEHGRAMKLVGSGRSWSLISSNGNAQLLYHNGFWFVNTSCKRFAIYRGINYLVHEQ